MYWWLDWHPKTVRLLLDGKSSSDSMVSTSTSDKSDKRMGRTPQNPLGMVECIQNPDETIYIPPNWFHAILNMEDFTIAATSNVLTPEMMKLPEVFTTQLPEGGNGNGAETASTENVESQTTVWDRYKSKYPAESEDLLEIVKAERKEWLKEDVVSVVSEKGECPFR